MWITVQGMPYASVFVGTSLDGFIARQDGTYNFLPPGGGEPHGYEEFMASVDALLIGRKTYETILGLGEWVYGNKSVYVLSSRELDPIPAATVERLHGDPAAVMRTLETRGVRHVYVDGGAVIHQFIHAGLISRIIVTRVPVLIGEGISLFGAVPRDVPLRHVATRAFPSGLVQSEYQMTSLAQGELKPLWEKGS
jgi:dihydrofolate reductase